MTTPEVVSEIGFVAVRISRSATIIVDGDLSTTFPLFGPMRERAWAQGWEPELLYGTEDEVKEGVIFRTPSPFANEQYYQWIISKFDSENPSIQYTVTAPERVWFIDVTCKAHKAQTLATITYTYTGLTPAGHFQNRTSLDNMFLNNLSDWEEAINYFLRTGKKL